MIASTGEELTQDLVEKECIPAALEHLRETVKKTSEAYGYPELDLGPLADE